MFDRIKSLIGEDKLKKISDIKVLLVGLGGVGGTALEALVRSGICNITVVDKDIFEESNLNRQILCTKDVIEEKKVDVAVNRVKEINKDCNITPLFMNIDESSINTLGDFDFIIDAIDDVDAKILLMKYANNKNIDIISSMGTGKRLDPRSLVITTLDKTINDPLAKIIRNKARKNNLSLKIPVVASREVPINNDVIIASSIFVPSYAGLLLAYYIIEKVIN